MTKPSLIFLLTILFLNLACSNPEPGPDKTIAGAALGAGWGAGAGAIVGNQVGNKGQGAAVGAGFGAVSGAMSGFAYDQTEDVLIDQEKQLASLRIQNTANRRELQNIQSRLDNVANTGSLGGVYQVYFDTDQTNLRAGAIANLEVIAEGIKRDPTGFTVHVVGHADDSGSPEYNERLAESRARTVSSYIAARGVSSDNIQVNSFGSKRPVASNVTTEGRQFNRRVDVFVSPKE
ncbi:MAG: OmpA family protein [Bdellovibrionales bacterium]|nr:OmpA family protein [Bdellovibrionales bacterium]